MRTKTTARFWRGYGIAVAAIVLILAMGLVVFYDFIGAYEASQPLVQAEAYIASLTEEDFGALIEAEAAQLPLIYEDAGTAAAACQRALSALEGDFACRREYGSGGDGVAYIITRGDTPIGAFTLRETEGGRYGFPAWEVTDTRAILTYLGADSGTVLLYAPPGSEVMLNGMLVSEEARIAENAPYPKTNPFASETDGAVVYRVTGLYGEADVQCSWNGLACPMEEGEDALWFLYPETAYLIYTVCAPEGAAVYVNGVEAAADYVTERDIPLSYAATEMGADGLPHAVRYTLPGLRNEPIITAQMAGISLLIQRDGTGYTAVYPSEQMYSTVIYAPAGSTVTMRGVSLEAYREEGSVESFPGLYEKAEKAPKMDVYRLSGLYLPPSEVEVRQGDTILRLKETEGELRALYPISTEEGAATRAASFTRDYFAYVAGGYRNTDANLAAALAHVQKGSALYTRIQKSKIGIEFVTPVTAQSYNQLEVVEMTALPDGAIYARVAFDITQKIYQVQRQYSGSLELICQKEGDAWVITEMLTDSDT